jgi:AraC family transcriptional activator of pobA
MKNFSLASQQLHAGADLLVQAIRTGEVVAQTSNAYRVIWLEAAWETGIRKLLIQPPGSLLSPQNMLEYNGFVVSFPEELLLMFGFEDAHPFSMSAALPCSHVTTVDLSCCPVAGTIERTIGNLKDQSRQLPKGHLLISGLLKILLVSVSRIFQQVDQVQINCADKQLFERFMSLVVQHNANKKGMQAYARALSVKTDVLSEAIKRVSGYPASHHIYRHIIRTAKHAAIGSRSSMKEVAYQLGFKDVAHFSKFFRNKAGMTFSDYKKTYQLL